MSIEKHREAINFVRSSTIEERRPKFRDSILNLDYKYLEPDDMLLLENLYFNLKDITLRKSILECLARNRKIGSNQFFLAAYKKERYLDMRLVTIRGYSKYASEAEVDKLMGNFIAILRKRPESTPCNYQEYEYLRSASGLPYLIKEYGYKCFIDAYNQEEVQYNNMPDAFKGIYTFDEEGNYVELRKPEEASRLIDEFFKQHRK